MHGCRAQVRFGLLPLLLNTCPTIENVLAPTLVANNESFGRLIACRLASFNRQTGLVAVTVTPFPQLPSANLSGTAALPMRSGYTDDTVFVIIIPP
jgi:hypothetical protein